MYAHIASISRENVLLQKNVLSGVLGGVLGEPLKLEEVKLVVSRSLDKKSEVREEEAVEKKDEGEQKNEGAGEKEEK